MAPWPPRRGMGLASVGPCLRLSVSGGRPPRWIACRPDEERAARFQLSWNAPIVRYRPIDGAKRGRVKRGGAPGANRVLELHKL